MGYYSTFYIDTPNLDFSNPNDFGVARNAARRLREITHNNLNETTEEDLLNSPDPLNEIVANDVYKWYTHVEDMATLAKEFPDVEFVLTVEGEDRNDNVRYFFKGEKYKECEGRLIYFNAPTWSSSDYEDCYYEFLPF